MIHVKMARLSASQQELRHSLNFIPQYTQSNKHPNNRSITKLYMYVSHERQRIDRT